MIKKMILSICVLMGVFVSNSAMAQCAAGGNLNDGVCYGVYGAWPYGSNPGDGQGSAGNNSGPVYVPPTVVNLWGAVAFDVSTGNFGYSQNKSSKSLAKQSAIADCNSTGCAIVGSYKNQCAGYAAGQLNGGWVTYLEFDKDKSVAKQNALLRCGTKAQNCQILMAECSRI